MRSVGQDLVRSLLALLNQLPDCPSGPQALAARLAVDKVLTSRLLAALRTQDALAALHRLPGPEPLRRVVRAVARRGTPDPAVARALAAIERFESLIRDRAGDRSTLDAIVSDLLPASQPEFQLRRKQAAFKAISQLRGVQAQALIATALLAPSRTSPAHLDIVWVNGLQRLHRIRPGAKARISTRKLDKDAAERRPLALDGNPVDSLSGLLLGDFCSSPPPTLAVRRAGNAVHYVLDQPGFGADHAVDIVFAEANFAEIDRHVPPGSGRKRYVFAEVSTPVPLLQFDLYLHRDLHPANAAPPALRIYDTSFEGVASPNNPARDLDLLDLVESVSPLPDPAAPPANLASALAGAQRRFASPDLSTYGPLIATVFDRLTWNPDHFVGFRCRIDYPVFGSQITLTMDPT